MSDSRVDSRAKVDLANPPDWIQYGGHYRWINDLSTPWVASPLIDKPNTAAYFFMQPITAPWDNADGHSIISTHQKKPRKLARVLQLLAEWIAKRNGAERSSVSQSTSRQPSSPPSFSRHPPAQNSRYPKSLFPISAQSHSPSAHVALPNSQDSTDNDEILPPEVQLREWKAWGYYAAPILNGVDVENYPPREDIPSSVNVEEVFASLVDADGNKHEEKWIPGLLHPAIPPRPKRWIELRNGDPLPFPWECQLNPYLQHFSFGAAPICWNIGKPMTTILIGKIRNASIPLAPSDLAQPATYPFVTHLYINALADDPLPFFPWPFMAYNPRGVTCGDVFKAISTNFLQYVSKAEFETWEDTRQFAAQLAFEARWGQAMDDEMRRSDFLGTHCWFRGIQPHPNREGWMMFTGIV